MENEELEKTLLREMIEGLTVDVAQIKLLLEQQPKPTTLLDTKSSLEQIGNAYSGLKSHLDTWVATQQKAPEPATPRNDLEPVLTKLETIRQAMLRSPANRISKAVQYGTGLLLISLLTTGVLAYYASKWRSERDAFEVSDWKWRGIRQVDAIYAQGVDTAFAKDSTRQQNKTWILQQEQADAAREAAQRAAEQAKAMNAQADQLEGKTGGKGKKK